MSDEQYKIRYRRLMTDRGAQVQAWMKALKVDEDITLLCYCKEGAFCHRRILATMIKHYRPDIEVVVH